MDGLHERRVSTGMRCVQARVQGRVENCRAPALMVRARQMCDVCDTTGNASQCIVFVSNSRYKGFLVLLKVSGSHITKS